jgi:catechol 2,3-dioxygenase-like lactoylglutathione lyase family enzyme
VALAHVTLATRELARSTAFFHEVLGWTPIGRPRNNVAPAAWLQIAPGQDLHLVEVPEFQPSPFEQEYGRHIAVSLPYSAFPTLKERLIAHGAKVIGPLRDRLSTAFSSATPMATSSRYSSRRGARKI